MRRRRIQSNATFHPRKNMLHACCNPFHRGAVRWMLGGVGMTLWHDPRWVHGVGNDSGSQLNVHRDSKYLKFQLNSLNRKKNLIIELLQRALKIFLGLEVAKYVFVNKS